MSDYGFKGKHALVSSNKYDSYMRDIAHILRVEHISISRNNYGELFTLSAKMPADVWIAGEKTSTTIEMPVAAFRLSDLPGCAGVCVSTKSKVEFPGKGIGTILNKVRQQMAWLDGYSLMLCTDVADNLPQQRVLAKNGWDKIDSFLNDQTGNVVNLHSIHLTDTGKKVGIVSMDELERPKPKAVLEKEESEREERKREER